MKELKSKVNAYLGFAQRAGKLISGEMAVLSALNKNRVRLILLAEDASVRTKRKFGDLSAGMGVPMTEYGSKEQLGSIIGKLPRSVIGVTDEHFATIISDQL
jgi:ribosomal protein L7Ae-like RNA K-turn-binding protein